MSTWSRAIQRFRRKGPRPYTAAAREGNWCCALRCGALSHQKSPSAEGARRCKDSSSLRASSGRALAGKAAVEGVPLFRHVDQQLRGREPRAARPLQPLAEFDERLGSHHVDIRERAAGERREAEPKN